MRAVDGKIYCNLTQKLSREISSTISREPVRRNEFIIGVVYDSDSIDQGETAANDDYRVRRSYF